MNKYKQDLINLQHNVEEKKKEIEEKEKLYRLNILSSKDREMAEFLHDRFCEFNHTNECDWYYDNGNWTTFSRKEYLEKAKRFNNYDPIIVKDIISLATNPV